MGLSMTRRFVNVNISNLKWFLLGNASLATLAKANLDDRLEMNLLYGIPVQENELRPILKWPVF